jgi:hypothetical protein
MFTSCLTSFQVRISWAIYGLPKVSLGLARPYHSTYGRPLLKRPYGWGVHVQVEGLQPSYYPFRYPMPHGPAPFAFFSANRKMAQAAAETRCELRAAVTWKEKE